MCRASNSWAVPTLSNVKDCIRDMCTPKSRWMPLHSMHTIIPKFVDSHVASEKETIVIRQQNARTGALAKLLLCYAETSDNAPTASEPQNIRVIQWKKHSFGGEEVLILHECLIKISYFETKDSNYLIIPIKTSYHRNAIYNRRDKLILGSLIRQSDGKRRFSHASSITERTWHALEKGQPLTIYDIQSLPFCEEQSQHWSFPGNRITHRMTACCNSTRLGLPLPASALPLASNARSRARSLQFTRTDIHARWSASSSAWKWYVLLSEIETMTVLRGVRRIVRKRRERSCLSIKRNTYNWWDRSLVCRPAPI